MNFIRSVSAALAVSALLVPASVWGHDGWVEPGSFLIERGQPVWLQLFLGNHSNGHRSYRLAGKWNLKYAKLLVIDPNGQESDLTPRLLDIGEDSEQVGPKGPKGFHVAPLTPKEEGVYIALAREEQVLQFGGGLKVLAIRTAKSVFAALTVPTVAAAKAHKGYDRAIVGARGLEIIPLTNPLGLREGEVITLEVRHKGKPIAGKVVSIIRKIGGPTSAQQATTDGQGRVTLTVRAPDLYLARTNVEEESERVEGRYEKSNYETTYVFPVFNR